MKKGISLLLAIIMMACVMSVSAFAAADTGYTIPADIQATIKKMQNLDANKNGTYETGDVTQVLRAAAGIVAEDDYSKYDINGDGYVTVKDAKTTLNAVTGVESIVSDEEILAVFNERANSVKAVFPGFSKKDTLDCSSILVTTKNAPMADLNVTNMEYVTYVDKLVAIMNKFPYNLALDDSMRAELANMQKAAQKAYDPQNGSSAVLKGSAYANAHFNTYPAGHTQWSSRLTMADIKDISYTMTGGWIKMTIKMDNYSYSGDNCPIELSERINTPYGKAFNLPELSEKDGSKVNSLAFKDGLIEFNIDYKTSDCIRAEYSYEYTADVKAAKDPDSDLEMTTKTTATLSERYTFNRVTY